MRRIRHQYQHPLTKEQRTIRCTFRDNGGIQVSLLTFEGPEFILRTRDIDEARERWTWIARKITGVGFQKEVK